MQFTGLLDKNGREIYEGDVVKDDKDNIGYIKYRADICSMEFEIKAAKGVAFYNYMGPKWTTEELKVIGNIYENPKLLEE